MSGARVNYIRKNFENVNADGREPERTTLPERCMAWGGRLFTSKSNASGAKYTPCKVKETDNSVSKKITSYENRRSQGSYRIRLPDRCLTWCGKSWSATRCTFLAIAVAVVVTLGILLGLRIDQCFNNPGVVRGDWITQLYTCSPVDGTCPRKIPGIHWMTQGMDITRMDLMPIEQSSGEDGWKYPVIDFTCNGLTTKLFGKEYDSPSQVTVKKKTGGEFSNDVEIYHSTSDIQERFSQTATIEGSYGLFSGSASASYSKLKRTKKNEKKFFSELRYNEYTAVATLKGPEYYILSSGPQSMIDAIDLPYSENKDSYLKFFKAYGTHFFKEGIFGGTFQVTVETKYTSLEKFDKEAWKVNIKLCYGVKKSNKSACASSETQNSNSNTNTESQFNLKEYKSYIGGDFDLAGVSNTAWQGTVKTSPRLITGTLEPISSMIKDKTKRANMEKAVTQYVLETFLESINTEGLGETEKKRVEDTLKSDLTVDKVKNLVAWLSLQRSDSSSARNTWKVETKTNSFINAETDSTIYIVIRGTSGNSPRLDLDTDKDDFESGATDTFWFTDVWNVGEVKSIVLYMLDGDDDGWLVESVFLTNDPLTGMTYVFENRAGRWLDGNNGEDNENYGSFELSVSSKSPV